MAWKTQTDPRKVSVRGGALMRGCARGRASLQRWHTLAPVDCPRIFMLVHTKALGRFALEQIFDILVLPPCEIPRDHVVGECDHVLAMFCMRRQNVVDERFPERFPPLLRQLPKLRGVPHAVLSHETDHDVGDAGCNEAFDQCLRFPCVAHPSGAPARLNIAGNAV
eukprot:CAMPEP_0170403136 /NCGR_PEP_ID=MMETSP0117_2-20130122/25937_1 /TAXON_ID=400756 /ORGANISM="Durinskia baltica, Strain CSIRO CS-38" /LENGTH=165 /DNA_ID=CAMNT_0010660065 /DNA_START=89 /DNA_END=582 /DNA_ORIENTATION=-